MLMAQCEFCLKTIGEGEKALEIQCGERFQHLGLVCYNPECQAKAIRLKKMQVEASAEDAE